MDLKENSIWDAAVIGAGPAGAMAAYQLAKRGAKVLLADRATFPRKKVCGSCLNQAAISLLREEGLGEIMTQNRAPRLGELWLACGRSHAEIPLPEGAALSREKLDAELVQKAVENGAIFLPDTRAALSFEGRPGFNLAESARVEPRATFESSARSVVLRQDGNEIMVKARVILAADGLAGQFLEKEPGFGTQTDPASRIGVGKVVKEAPAFYDFGKIYMACARQGYLGMVRLEDGRLNVAAAFDPEFLRMCGGAGAAARRVLEESHLPLIPELEDSDWLGTFPLTRKRSRVAGHRIFVIGDSAGYTEPFTGEGITMALTSGIAVTGFVLQGIREWKKTLERDWTECQRTLVIRRQGLSRWTAKILRCHPLTRIIVQILSWNPGFAAPWIKKTNRRFRSAGFQPEAGPPLAENLRYGKMDSEALCH